MNFTELSPLSSRGAVLSGTTPRAGAVAEPGYTRLAPPRGFRPLHGPVSDVQFGGRIPFHKGNSQAQKLGLAYERRVHDVLENIYVDKFRATPSILYRDKKSRLRRAIPDGLLEFPDYLLAIEIKLTHTEKAWWQLVKLYQPLLQNLYPGRRVLLVEICRSYDPAVQFPLPHKLIHSLRDVPLFQIGVLEWKI